MKKFKLNKLIILLFTMLCIYSPAQAERKLTVWAMGYEGTRIGEMARRFERENPGIKVITQAVPWGAAHEKLLTSVIGGVPPDVSQMGTTWIAEFQAMNAFEPLNSYFKDSEISREDFFESSFGIGEIDGKVYGVPWYVETRVLFYRKDILKDSGYDRPPANWKEFLEVCTKLAGRKPETGGVENYGISLPVKDVQVFLPFLWQAGGGILSGDRKKILVKEDSFARAVEYYKSFFEYKAAPVKDPGYDLKWAFKMGIYPMFISGPWNITQIRNEIPEIEGKWGVSVLPGNLNRDSFVGGSHLVIFRDSPNKDIAWKFIQFMSRYGNQLKWYEITGGLPSNKKAWQTGYFSDKPGIKVFGDQMLQTKSPPNIPEWEEVASSMEQRLEEVIMGKETVPEMQQLLYDDIDRVINEKAKGSRSVLLWFLIITLAGIALIGLYARYAVKKGKRPLDTDIKKLPPEMEQPGGIMGKGFSIYLMPWLFILPSLAVLMVFLFFPIFSSFLISLTNWNVHSFSDISSLRFIGFDNYMSLFGNKVFWQALLNTVIFSGLGIPLNVILALFVAVMIDKKYIKTKAILRSGYFMPVVTTLVAVAVVWRWLYNPEYGLINYMVGLLGIDKQNWLSNPYLALPSLIVMSVWKNFGYNMVIILAGLQTIPSSLYESASVDGADAWQTFWNITLPNLRPTLFFVVVMTTIGSFQFFAEPYIMTKGGPLNRTLSMVMYMYNQGFKYFKFGSGSAVAYILFVCILAFTFIQILYRRKMEE